jgi:hypothetical protein
MADMKRVYVIMCAAVILAMACDTAQKRPFSMQSPAGFAVYTKELKMIRSISSDGVRLRAWHVKNDPPGDTTMWNEAVTAHLTGLGYHRKDQAEITSDGGSRGLYSEYSYWYNGEDYSYALALFGDSDYMYVIECTGKADQYQKRKDSVMKSIKSFAILSK